jgi:hypothetical protein
LEEPFTQSQAWKLSLERFGGITTITKFCSTLGLLKNFQVTLLQHIFVCCDLYLFRSALPRWLYCNQRSLIPSNIKEVLGLLDLKLQCKENNHLCLATSQTSSCGGDLGGGGGLVNLWGGRWCNLVVAMNMVVTKLNRRDQIFGGAPMWLAKLMYFLSTRTFLFPHKFCKFFNFYFQLCHYWINCTCSKNNNSLIILFFFWSENSTCLHVYR